MKYAEKYLEYMTANMNNIACAVDNDGVTDRQCKNNNDGSGGNECHYEILCMQYMKMRDMTRELKNRKLFPDECLTHSQFNFCCCCLQKVCIRRILFPGCFIFCAQTCLLFICYKKSISIKNVH